MISKASVLVAAAFVSGAIAHNVTALTSCHYASSTQFCIEAHGKTGTVSPAPTNPAAAPTTYTSCQTVSGVSTLCTFGTDVVQFNVVSSLNPTTSTAAPASSSSMDHNMSGMSDMSGMESMSGMDMSDMPGMTMTGDSHAHDHASSTATAGNTTIVSSSKTSSPASSSSAPTSASAGGANTIAAGVMVGAGLFGALLL